MPRVLLGAFFFFRTLHPPKGDPNKKDPQKGNSMMPATRYEKSSQLLPAGSLGDRRGVAPVSSACGRKSKGPWPWDCCGRPWEENS